jgi:hypothetical protein
MFVGECLVGLVGGAFPDGVTLGKDVLQLSGLLLVT